MLYRLLTLPYYLLFAFVYLGFILHRGRKPQIGPWSVRYAIFLAIFALGFLVPSVIRRVSKRYGAKHLIFSLLPAALFVVITYLAGAYYYYYSAEHLFDPFLQIQPHKLGAADSAKTPGTFRILTLGGSTTADLRLPLEARYPRLLEGLVQKKHPDLKIEVFNGGQDWYTTKHALINYTTNLKDWQPDLSIVMHAINDVYRSFADPEYTVGGYNTLWSHYYGPAIQGAKPPTFEKFLLSFVDKYWFYDQRYRERDLPLDRYRSLPEFRRNLSALIHYLKVDGVRVVLMTEPTIYKDVMSPEEQAALWFGKSLSKERSGRYFYEYPSPSSLRRAMEAYNQVVKETGARENVSVIDLDSKIPKTLEYFLDDCHYREEGARLVAATIAEELEQFGAMTKPSPEEHKH